MDLYKNDHFSKFFFLRQYRSRKCLLQYFRTKKRLFQAKKKPKSSKSRKICIFFKGVNPFFWSKNDHSFIFFFLGNIGQEDLFYGILERNNAFLDYKNKTFLKSINCHYSRGVNPCFWSKNCHFFNFFFLGNIGQEKCVFRYSRTKKRLSRL